MKVSTQDEAKNEETTVCVAKAADDTKEDEKKNELMEDTKENVMDNVLEEPLEIISREFCEKKVSATTRLTTLWSTLAGLKQ